MTEEIPGIPGAACSLLVRQSVQAGSHKLFSLLKMIQNGWVSCSLYPPLKLCLCWWLSLLQWYWENEKNSLSIISEKKRQAHLKISCWLIKLDLLNHIFVQAGVICGDLGRFFGSECRRLWHPCAATESLKTSCIERIVTVKNSASLAVCFIQSRSRRKLYSRH